MRRINFFLSLVAVMALLVASAAPAMAANNNNNDNNNKNDNHNNFFRNNNDNNFNVFRNDNNNDDFCDFFDCNFNRFDRFDNGFNNGFGDLEQDADSGDIVQTFDVSGSGDNSNQCVGITGNANTGNAQNQIGLTDFGGFNGFDNNRFDDNPFFFDGFNGNSGGFGFDDTGATLDVSGTSTTTCNGEVNQAAAAG
jgi:hypothetical protein